MTSTYMDKRNLDLIISVDNGMYCITTCTWSLHSMQYANLLNNDKATNTDHTPPKILLKSAVTGILRDLPLTSERT